MTSTPVPAGPSPSPPITPAREIKAPPEPIRFWMVLVAALIGTAVLGGLWYAAWTWKGQPEDAAQWYEIARTMTFAFAALGVLPAGFIAYRRQRTHEWELQEDRREQDHREHVEATRTAELDAKIARDAADLQLANTRADQAAYRTRYAESAAQLGHDKPAIRLAGVYAMAQLADDWADRAARQQCIDVLCAYLRMPFPTDMTGRPLPGEVQVRETVVRVITAHLRADATTPWRGANFDFTGSEFAAGTYDFSQAQFTSGGTVTFQHAKFAGDTVSFDGAEFTGGTVDFNGAQFTGGTVTFQDAKFAGGTVDFSGAKFTGGTVLFNNAKFTSGKVRFIAAGFTGGTVAFFGAGFTGSRVEFTLARFTGGTITFNHAEFTGGTVAFDRTEFTGGVVTRDGQVFRGWPPPDPDPGPVGPGAG